MKNTVWGAGTTNGSHLTLDQLFTWDSACYLSGPRWSQLICLRQGIDNLYPSETCAHNRISQLPVRTLWVTDLCVLPAPFSLSGMLFLISASWSTSVHPPRLTHLCKAFPDPSSLPPLLLTWSVLCTLCYIATVVLNFPLNLPIVSTRLLLIQYLEFLWISGAVLCFPKERSS